jgi:hypothetical protein
MAEFGKMLQLYAQNPQGTLPSKNNDYSIQTGENILSIIGF